MVIISSRWSSHFRKKMHVSSTSLNNKSTAGGWNDAKCLFMCYFTYQAYKITIYRALTLISNLCKIQDGDHCWWRHRPPAAPPPIKYTSTCREHQRLSTEAKIVSKYCNISTLWGGVPTPPPTPPPPPPVPCTTVRVWICVYVRGLNVCGAYKLRCSSTCTTNVWNSYFYFHGAHRIQDFFNHVFSSLNLLCCPPQVSEIIFDGNLNATFFSDFFQSPSLTSNNKSHFFRRDLYSFLLVC